MPGKEREHIHDYRLQRGVIEAGHAYMFWICSVSGCHEPFKMTIDKAEVITWPSGAKRYGFRG